MTDPQHIQAPFTQAQITSLNAYQQSGVMHPFTCGLNSRHRLLRATADGWACPDCHYTQNWAHAFMTDGSWRQMQLPTAGQQPAPAIGDGQWELLGMADGTLFSAHGRDRCHGEPCCIHNPSGHSLREAPLRWRPDLYIMERVCPHDRSHPDPDSVAYLARTLDDQEWADQVAAHDCDGCCQANAEPPDGSYVPSPVYGMFRRDDASAPLPEKHWWSYQGLTWSGWEGVWSLGGHASRVIPPCPDWLLEANARQYNDNCGDGRPWATLPKGDREVCISLIRDTTEDTWAWAWHLARDS